jgi:hypothetical protein
MLKNVAHLVAWVASLRPVLSTDASNIYSLADLIFACTVQSVLGVYRGGNGAVFGLGVIDLHLLRVFIILR